MDTSAVAELKTAASKAAKAFTASPGNSTLAASNLAATAAFAVADAALTEKKVEVAALLACFAGIFSFASAWLAHMCLVARCLSSGLTRARCAAQSASPRSGK